MNRARRHWFVCALGFSVCLGVFAIAGCRTAQEGAPVVTPQRPLEAVLAEHTPALMKIAGVVGTYQGATDDGKPCITVMVAHDSPELRAAIPATLEGWPVVIDVTGEIKAMPRRGS